MNHLLFADDYILFSQFTSADATKMMKVLTTYLKSGQHVNNDKSSLFFGKGCPMVIRESIKEILDVPHESLNEKYLGLPSDVGTSKNRAFGYLKDRVWKKLRGWMERALSGGGKEILIK